MSVLFVGQMPSSRPGPPLSGRCGERLAHLLGMSCRDFLDAFPRRNVVAERHDRFPAMLARSCAATMPLDGVAALVLCGRRVATAFELGKVQPLAVCDARGLPALVIPHPSGKCRWWNDRNACRAAQEAIQEFVTRHGQIPAYQLPASAGPRC